LDNFPDRQENGAYEEVTGLIVKITGGFYYVDLGDRILECRARGVFRKRETTPLVGDHAVAAALPDNKGYVMEILPRKNALQRPPVANLDQLVLVVSAAQPAPNLLVLDKLIAICEHQDLEPALVFTKCDLADAGPYSEIYRKAGFAVLETSFPEGRGAGAVRDLLAGKVSAFCGNSGVGKSTLLNAICPELCLSTAEISKKLGRGRHTTRHTELFPLENGGRVADTPGFSAVDLERLEVIRKDALEFCFREFAPYQGKCRFVGCSHTSEKGCAVLEAVRAGEIPASRHRSYCALYEEAKLLKEWDLKEPGGV